MYRATTPTITFNFPNTIDMTEAEDVYVTFKNGKSNYKLTKTIDDGIVVTEHTVVATLSQVETLKFLVGTTATQVNWTYNEGNKKKRACTNIVDLTIKENLLNEVI